MVKIENVKVDGFEAAIRGMRNSYNSWDKSDSYTMARALDNDAFIFGENDMALASELIDSGSSERKFMRMIICSMDIIAPLYWWKEFDTYKVGTVANSCSTMHSILDKPFEINDFSFDGGVELEESVMHECLVNAVDSLNYLRDLYFKQFDYLDIGDLTNITWRSIIQLLPESYNQRRTVTLNYEVLAKIYKERRNHKLKEWKDFCAFVMEHLPYAELLIANNKEATSSMKIYFDMNDYQKLAARTINEELTSNELEMHAVLGMSAELGEIISEYPGDGVCDNARERLKEEIGDLLWFVAEYCTADGTRLNVLLEDSVNDTDEEFIDFDVNDYQSFIEDIANGISVNCNCIRDTNSILNRLVVNIGAISSLYQKTFQGHVLDSDSVYILMRDVMLNIGLLCDSHYLNLNLREIMEMNIKKLTKRYPNGFEVERSVNRKNDNNFMNKIADKFNNKKASPKKSDEYFKLIKDMVLNGATKDELDKMFEHCLTAISCEERNYGDSKMANVDDKVDNYAIETFKRKYQHDKEV